MRRSAWSALLAGALLAPGAASAEVVDRVAAVVNDEVILLSEVAEAEAQFRQLGGAPEVPDLRNQVVDQLVGRKLMEQAMDVAGLKVDEPELQRYLGMIEKQYGLSEEQLRAEVERNGATWEEFLADKRQEIRYDKFLQMEIRQRMQIEETDLRSAYNQRAAAAPKDPRVHLWMALIRHAEGDDASREATMAKARDLADAIRAGRSFAEVAAAESALPNAAQGGDSGFVRLEDLNSEFRQVLEGLPPEGGVAEPVVTSQGVWLLAVSERREAGVPPFEEMRQQLWRELAQEREERAIERWVEQRRRESHVEVLLPRMAVASPAPATPEPVPVDPGPEIPAPAPE